MGSTVVTGGKMRRHGLFLSVDVKVSKQERNEQLDVNGNLRQISPIQCKILQNKKSYRKHGKHFCCSKTILLLFMHLIILSVNKCVFDCDASPIPATSDILLDSLPTVNEDDHINYYEPYQLTPVFPSEELTGKQDEDVEDNIRQGDVSTDYWRYLPSIARIDDDNDALDRFVWPSRFMSAYHGPRRDELSSMFRNPFTKRAARGHLRFVKPRYYSRRSAKRRSADTNPTIQDLLKVLELKLKELQLIVKRAS